MQRDPWKTKMLKKILKKPESDWTVQIQTMWQAAQKMKQASVHVHVATNNTKAANSWQAVCVCMCVFVQPAETVLLWETPSRDMPIKTPTAAQVNIPPWPICNASLIGSKRTIWATKSQLLTANGETWSERVSASVSTICWQQSTVW